MMRRDTGCVSDETSGVGLGLSGRRDGFGTEPGMSHNRNREYQVKKDNRNIQDSYESL